MSERAAEIRDVAAALREVIERFVATSAPLEVFEGVAGDLRSIADRLAGYPQEHTFMGFPEAANAGGSGEEHEAEGPWDNSPLMGRANPLAPPLRLRMLEDRVVGTVTFHGAYEGPPGHVHGGYVAAAFDELLGLTQALGGQPGMTGRLTIHYRSPTPLNEELRMEGVVDRVDGRKCICTGSLWHGDTLLAESEGLFVRIDPERFQRMMEARGVTSQVRSGSGNPPDPS
jgi:acyl-coenzyme A thioesterase PaaI-like protein